ncbi:MAG: ABC transporter substrate-binding protein, partial [bacterium]
PYAKQYWREGIAGFVVYDDHTLSVSLPEAQAYAPALVGSLTPSAPHFYQDYGPDYTERYQWKFPPTTGAYEVLDKDIVKGVSITQSRVKNWWAKDNKYYKYRFNPDRIKHVVVRDEPKSFELFRAGQIDMFHLTRPMYWYEKSEIEPVYKGYI